MATTTSNYSLIKPELTEYYDISVQNNNMDTIDTALKTNSDAAIAAQEEIDTHEANTQNPHNVTAAQVGAVPATDVGVAGGVAAYDDVMEISTNAYNLSQNNLLNILRMKLQLALASSDIDAWSDLFADSLMINSTESTRYMISGGSLSCRRLEMLSISSEFVFSGGSPAALGQLIVISEELPLTKIKIKLRKASNPLDSVLLKVYSVTESGAPDTVIYTSDTVIYGSTLTTALTEYEFLFTDATLSANTAYSIVVQRTGASDGTNCYYVGVTNSYSGLYRLDGTTWTALTCHMYFVIEYNNAIVIWNSVTSTEALKNVAITTEQYENDGTITWYLSDDSSNWIEITSFDTIQEVNFDESSIYLKCEITGDATVKAVAFGGY